MSEWIYHIAFLYQLQRGGYPFEKDDLTVKEWTDLGKYRDFIEVGIGEQKSGKGQPGKHNHKR